jgi:dinuclear metal center YbgI/SA1388 family protein
MATRDAIVSLLDDVLRTGEIKDSSCNGLQVQGAADVLRVGLAVDACLEAYEKAAAAGCQMVIVHHGLIWNGLKSVTGRNYRHVRFLIEHGLNLYASHLPLDMHEEYGNNIGLARALGLKDIQAFGSYHEMVIGFRGVLPEAAGQPPEQIADRLARQLGGKPVVLPCGVPLVRTVGIVSGGAGDMVEQAADARLDCYVTGEPVHFSFQLSRELGANVIFLGHYHSETLGVRALGRLLTEKLGVESVFLEIDAFAAGNYTD